jgi:hypothetical protein
MILTQNIMIAYTLGDGPGFTTNDASVSGPRWCSHHQKIWNTAKKIEFKFNYNNNTNDFELSPIGNSASTLDNSSNQNLYNFKFDYSQPIKFSDEGN